MSLKNTTVVAAAEKSVSKLSWTWIWARLNVIVLSVGKGDFGELAPIQRPSELFQGMTI